MLRIDRAAKTLKTLDQKKIRDANLLERADVQRMIRHSPEAFFEELGEKLLLLGEEVRPAESVEDRVDLLALDPTGAAVVLELKRGNHKLHLLQALSYAAMIGKWDGALLVAERAKLTKRAPEDAQEEVDEFLFDAAGSLNGTQRVILVAGDFDYEVLVTAEWLSERFGLDIRCYRLSYSADGKSEYVSCVCVYPPPELAEHAKRRGRGGKTKPSRWADWDAALKAIDNEAVVSFYRTELEAKQYDYLRRRMLRYSVDDKRRLSVIARRKFAYVWQTGRFANDETFWTKRLGRQIDLQPVKDARSLRFYLRSKKDFERFAAVVKGDLQKVEFLSDGDDADEPD
jgi:hypothetical protein